MIYAVAKNYHAHAKEMGGTVPGEPMWFLKPDASQLPDGGSIALPEGKIHHEVELAIRIGANLQPDAYTVAIDVTNRTLQTAAKQAGTPWTRAKGHKTFCPIGAWRAIDCDLQELSLRLAVNGVVRQEASTSLMVHSIATLLAHLQTWAPLQPGDIILTGTPAGVGPIHPGDVIEASCHEAHIQVSAHLHNANA